MPVPEDIADDIALRGYINPLAAQLMLRRWPVRDRQIILTAAGSDCARLLGQWALAGGARQVIGLHRAPEHAPRLRRLGIQPLTMDRQDEILWLAAHSSLVFDAVGGRWAAHCWRVSPCRDAGKLWSALGATCPRHARLRRAATVSFARCPGRDVRQRLAERLYRPLAFTASRAVIAAGALSAKPLARGAVAVLPVRPRRQASPVSGVVSAGARGDDIRLSASILPLSAATRRPAGPDSAYRPAVRRWNGGPPDAWAASSMARARHHPAPNAPAAGSPPPALAG
ncbi:hypothetical protein SODG_004048 [Sodalis praecaptivus]